MKTFVQIPRAWFVKDGVWWKLNSEQRAALVTLCSAVSFCGHEVEVKGVKIWLEKGQFVTSVRKLAEMVDLSERKVRTLINVLKSNDIITISTLNKDATQQMTQSSLLTINDLHDLATQQTTQDIIKDKQKKIFKEKNNKKEKSKPDVPKRFTPPTPEEVQAYLDEKGIAFFTGQEFVDYYEQGGWVYGANHTPVRNWKACVTTWLKKQKQTPTYNGNTQTNIYCNGIAGREERLRRAEQLIMHTLANPGPSADEMFDF